MNANLKITVVYGGVSTEREVSLNSGKAVYEALTAFGYRNVTLFDLRGDNIGELISLRPELAFLALHGKGGEDGCIQGALELAGIPYTGSGVASSALCMNKVFSKQVLKAAGIPTADYLEFRKAECPDADAAARKIVSELGMPVVLKAPCQGSSIGVIIVHREGELRDAIGEIFRYGDQLLAEAFLDGTEITLPILGNSEMTILPEIEITSEREFYDYQAKYTSGLCHHITPARISERDRDRVKKIGARVYRTFNCCGLARIDFIIDRTRGPMVIEVNTLPGMTDMSLVPDAARAAGISFGELVSRIAGYGLTAKRDLG